MIKDISEHSTKLCIDKLKNCSNLQEGIDLLSAKPVLSFEDYLSEHMFKKKLEKLELYSEPIKFTIGNETIEVEPGRIISVPREGTIMDIEFQIVKFFEIDGILDAVLKYQEELMNLPNGIYKNFVNGSFWKSVVERNEGKTLIPLFLYSDDFVIGNKKGPHSQENSLCAFYYMFPTAPPQIVSKLNSIFVAMFAKSIDLKKHGNESPEHTLLNIFKRLEVEGVTLFKSSNKEKKVHIIFSKILGDNLGIHILCGFNRNFRGGRPCIFCEITFEMLKISSEINPDLIRTLEKYNQYFINGTFNDFGLKCESKFNDLPSFHVIMNKIVDIMHDIQLGVIKFVLQCALNYFIFEKKYFDLSIFNLRLKNFDFGSKERLNKPCPVSENHLKTTLHMNANESLFCLRYFPLLVKDLVPRDDVVYAFILDTIDVVDLCYASKFDLNGLEELKSRISANRQEYMRVFNQHLRPKDHHMLHYVSSIEENGPLKYLSSIRPEAKHQVILGYTASCMSRRNINYSVTKKQSFSFSEFLIHNDGKTLLSKVSDLNIRRNVTTTDEIKNYILQNNYHGNFFEGLTKQNVYILIIIFTFNSSKISYIYRMQI